MSKALDYLLQVRPEAMQSYFAFFREAGRHLDPKTRALISVITKVDKQTRSGFRQYLNRALREGVTANEVLDALLMAFPTLGLTKVVWAIDILLQMDLPDFAPQALLGGPAWHDAAALDDLPANGTTRIVCDGRGLFIHHDMDGLRVYSSRCPHQGTDIPASGLAAGRLSCPRHGWSFDTRTGACIGGGDRPLVEFPHRIDDGRLLVSW